MQEKIDNKISEYIDRANEIAKKSLVQTMNSNYEQQL